MGSSFTDLKIWQNGFTLLLRVYEITSRYPKEEKYGLISDTRRSANSIIANIAESHGRFHFADKVRVLLISRGEIEEIKSHILVGYGLKYLTEAEFKELDQGYQELAMMVNGYINNIEARQPNS